jgi:hypothetical protein
LYGCETWSLTLREEHGVRVFDIRVLRIIFGPKREEVIGELRKLKNEELILIPDIIRQIKLRIMRWAGHVARTGEECVQGCDRKVRRKRPLGRPRGRWEDVIRMDLREIGLGSVDWIHLA